MGSLNLRRVLALVAIVLVVGGGVYLAHGIQLKRNALAWLEYADQSRDAGESAEETRYLRLYLRSVPRDSKVRTRLGLALDKSARTPDERMEAFQTLGQAIRGGADSGEIRRRLVHLAMDLRRYTDASAHLEILLKSAPADAELLELLGICLEAQGQFADAEKAYEKACASNPHQIGAYERVCRLLRYRLDDPIEADRRMKEMVAANEQSFQAYLCRARYYLAKRVSTSVNDASADVQRALELAPDEVDVLLAAAHLVQAKLERIQTKTEFDALQPEIEQASQYLRRARELKPQDARSYMLSAELERRAGRPDEAVAQLRRGLEANADHSKELLLTLTELLIEQGELQEAQQNIEQLTRRKDVSRGLLTYLDGRLLMQQKRWFAAAAKLERARSLLALSPDLSIQVDLPLGQCYEQLAQPDRQLEAFRRALKAAPGSDQARLGIASSLSALGRINESLTEYRRLMGLPNVPFLVARLLLLRNSQLRQGKGDWQEFNAALEQAQSAMPGSIAIPILRADALSMQGQEEQAMQLLLATRDANPDTVQCWVALARFVMRTDSYDKAVQVLNGAEQRLGDHASLRLLRAIFCAQQGGTDAPAVLAGLAADVEKFADEDQKRLLAGLAEAYAIIGDVSQAIVLWRKVAERVPDDPHPRLRLFDLAAQAGDDSSMQAVLQEVRSMEGAAGPLGNYGEALRLLQLAKERRDTRELPKARTLLAQAAAVRPNWAQVPRLEAEMDELEGNPQRALENYRRSIELGPRRPQVVARIVHLLYNQRRYREADEEVRKLGEPELVPDELQGLVSELALRSNDFDRALALASQAVSSHPQDYQDRVWLGQVLWLLAQSKKKDRQHELSETHTREAEQAFRKAVQLADSVPQTWVALVAFLAESGQQTQAEAAIGQAERKIPAEERALALGACYERIGRNDRAEELYLAALRARPEDLLPARSLARLYILTGQTQKAEAQLRGIIDRDTELSKDDIGWARRSLARLIAADGRQVAKALELIEQNAGKDGASTEDDRAKAAVLALQNSRSMRREAISILERLLQRQQPTVQDRLLLAQLYEAEGDWPKTRAHMLSAVDASGQNPIYVAKYANSLLRQGMADEAAPWTRRLEQAEPDSFLTMSTKARWLAARGQGEQVTRLVKSYVESMNAQGTNRILFKLHGLVAQSKAEEAIRLLDAHLSDAEMTVPAETIRSARELLTQGKTEDMLSLLRDHLQSHQAELSSDAERTRLAASLLEELNQTVAAEEMYQAYVSLADLPDARLALVAFLARQRRPQEALDLCERLWTELPPQEIAPVSVTVLRTAGVGQEDCQRVERWLDAAIQKNSTDAALLLCLADLRDFQARFDDAAMIYRTIINRDNRNVIALNNLAFLLAHKDGGAAEALSLINRAIGIAGPAPELLDTRASVFLALGDVNKAVEDLHQAIDRTGINTAAMASQQFHLARAYHMARRTGDAQVAFRQARDSAGTVPHPLERRTYEGLTKELALDKSN